MIIISVNSGFVTGESYQGEVSSACEVLYGLFDPEKVVRTIAVPIYTGMVHDTGVFQYSSNFTGDHAYCRGTDEDRIQFQ